RGEKDAALARARLALQIDPGYEWAWSALRRWAAELDRRSEADSFARELTVTRPGEARSWWKLAETLTRPEDRDERLAAIDRAPARAISHGYRGEGRYRCGDRAGATEDFRRAFEMDPTYGFAGMFLFDLQLGDGELDAAAATLAALKKIDDDAYVRTREVKLA